MTRYVDSTLASVLDEYREVIIRQHWHAYFSPFFGWSDAAYASEWAMWAPWWPWRVGAQVRDAVGPRLVFVRERVGDAWWVLRTGLPDGG